MPLTDPLGDMLTRIRNGQQARKDSVVSPASKLRVRVLDVLQREGYIRGYSEEAMGPAKGLRIELKYFEGQPAIQHLSRISKPGRRVYSGSQELPGSATALASPSSRRHAAFCPTRKRATRTSAARCWRRYSDEPHW
jgi:small subunit ribosomal protein S8